MRTLVGPIIDYLYQQRFVPQAVTNGSGSPGETSPPQPTLTLKGRTPDSLLRQVAGWHKMLAHSKQPALCWDATDIEPFTIVQTSQANNDQKTWTIKELLSSRALVTEGRQMKHCVATYVAVCARRESSIWTMEVESSEGRSKLLTVQVNNEKSQICQARGKINRLPTDEEYYILRRWAAQAGLTVASYV